MTAIAGFCLLGNVLGLFIFTGVALCVFGYIGLTLWLISKAGKGAKHPKRAEVGNAFIILSWVAVLVSGICVGMFHWVQYRHAAFVVLGIYALACVIWIVGRAVTALVALVVVLFGAAMASAVVGLGPPVGAEDMEKSENWTHVSATVVDSQGRPISGATVYLDLLWFWQSEPPLDASRDYWATQKTYASGIAEMSIPKDARFKRLVIRVRCEPFNGGYNPPATMGGYVGYKDVRIDTSLPVPRAHYAYKVVMEEREHPNSAFLELELNEVGTPGAARHIKLALTAEPDLPWYEGHRTFNDYGILKSGGLREFYSFSGSQEIAIDLGTTLAARPLTLHLVERDFSRNEECWAEVGTIAVDATALGGHRRCRVTVPPRGAVRE